MELNERWNGDTDEIRQYVERLKDVAHPYLLDLLSRVADELEDLRRRVPLAGSEGARLDSYDRHRIEERLANHTLQIQRLHQAFYRITVAVCTDKALNRQEIEHILNGGQDPV